MTQRAIVQLTVKALEDFLCSAARASGGSPEELTLIDVFRSSEDRELNTVSLIVESPRAPKTLEGCRLMKIGVENL